MKKLLEDQMEWNKYFLNIAEQVKLKSKDESTQIGAVIVGMDREILSTGYNSFPRGLVDSMKERQERPLKYHFMCHAETSAIINAARIGVSTKNSTLYLTCGIPCTDCARNIINAGIKTVYCYDDFPAKEKWIEQREISLTMFFECDVQVIYY
jgi:dCMP deaminase